MRMGRAGSRWVYILVLLFFIWSLEVRMGAIVVVSRHGVCVVAVAARDIEPRGGKWAGSWKRVRRYRRRNFASLQESSLNGVVAWDWYLTAVNCVGRLLLGRSRSLHSRWGGGLVRRHQMAGVLI